MKALTSVFAITTIIAGGASVYLLQQLHAERQRAGTLQNRVTDLELALARPSTAVAPPLAAEHAAVPATTADATQPGAPVAATPDAAASTAKPAASNSVNVNALIASDPAFRAGVTASVRQSIAQNYPDLAKELDLSPEQLGKLFDILSNSAVNMMGVTGTGTGESGRSSAAQNRAEAQRKQEEEIRALLGDAKNTQWKDYQQSLPARQQVGRLRTGLESSGGSLSQRQQQQLIAVLASEQKRQTAELTQVAQSMGIQTGAATSPRDSVSMMEQMVRSAEERNQRILDSASAWLNPQQLDALKAQQDQELQMTRALLRAQPGAGQPQAGPAGN